MYVKDMYISLGQVTRIKTHTSNLNMVEKFSVF